MRRGFRLAKAGVRSPSDGRRHSRAALPRPQILDYGGVELRRLDGDVEGDAERGAGGGGAAGGAGAGHEDQRRRQRTGEDHGLSAVAVTGGALAAWSATAIAGSCWTAALTADTVPSATLSVEAGSVAGVAQSASVAFMALASSPAVAATLGEIAAATW